MSTLYQAAVWQCVTMATNPQIHLLAKWGSGDATYSWANVRFSALPDYLLFCTGSYSKECSSCLFEFRSNLMFWKQWQPRWKYSIICCTSLWHKNSIPKMWSSFQVKKWSGFKVTTLLIWYRLMKWHWRGKLRLEITSLIWKESCAHYWLSRSPLKLSVTLLLLRVKRPQESCYPLTTELQPDAFIWTLIRTSTKISKILITASPCPSLPSVTSKKQGLEEHEVQWKVLRNKAIFLCRWIDWPFSLSLLLLTELSCFQYFQMYDGPFHLKVGFN